MIDLNLPIIYCVLITGKNDDRYKFIPIALDNFKIQTYPNKKLLIINHGNRILFPNENKDKDVIEIMFKKTENFTLGDMRNFSISIVPYESIFCIFDDDDYRHPRYIELLYKEMVANKADVVFFKNRIDYNINTNFGYRSKFDKGMPFILAKKIENIKYLSKNSLEDIRLYLDYDIHNKKIHVINNDPRWYIRLIHGSNTSLFIDNNKKSIINYSDESKYHEYELTDKENNYTNTIIKKYFQSII
jgi:hypothetical protein